jgi:adenylate kinase family enzyme
MQRVAVMGPSGSGKTTVARQLAERLGVVHVELDALHHGPNWTEVSAEELQAAVARELEDRESWVVDGNYGAKLGDLVLRQADTVVWLDLPLQTCLLRLWRRSSERIRDDVELWHGNREAWRNLLWGRDSLFAWSIRMHRRSRRAWPNRFNGFPGLAVVRLRTTAEVEAWLATQGRLSAPG